MDENIAEAIIRVVKSLLPETCPSCKGRHPGAINDKGICDTCFVREAHQRAAFSLDPSLPDENTKKFSFWFLEHTEEQFDERG